MERAFRSRQKALDVPLSALVTRDSAFAARLIAFAIGEEPADISAGDGALLEGGEDLAVAGGLGVFVAQYGADVPVRLSSQV